MTTRTGAAYIQKQMFSCNKGRQLCQQNSRSYQLGHLFFNSSDHVSINSWEHGISGVSSTFLAMVISEYQAPVTYSNCLDCLNKQEAYMEKGTPIFTSQVLKHVTQDKSYSWSINHGQIWRIVSCKSRGIIIQQYKMFKITMKEI